MPASSGQSEISGGNRTAVTGTPAREAATRARAFQNPTALSTSLALTPRSRPARAAGTYFPPPPPVRHLHWPRQRCAGRSGHGHTADHQRDPGRQDLGVPRAKVLDPLPQRIPAVGFKGIGTGSLPTASRPPVDGTTASGQPELAPQSSNEVRSLPSCPAAAYEIARPGPCRRTRQASRHPRSDSARRQ